MLSIAEDIAGRGARDPKKGSRVLTLGNWRGQIPSMSLVGDSGMPGVHRVGEYSHHMLNGCFLPVCSLF